MVEHGGFSGIVVGVFGMGFGFAVGVILGEAQVLAVLRRGAVAFRHFEFAVVLGVACFAGEAI
jgi:hypothetical protein